MTYCYILVFCIRKECEYIFHHWSWRIPTRHNTLHGLILKSSYLKYKIGPQKWTPLSVLRFPASVVRFQATRRSQKGFIWPFPSSFVLFLVKILVKRKKHWLSDGNSFLKVPQLVCQQSIKLFKCLNKWPKLLLLWSRIGSFGELVIWKTSSLHI